MTRRLFLIIGLLALSFEQAAAGPALVFDPHRGTVLYAEDIDSPWHPASLTKLMTAYMTFKALREGRITMKSTVRCSQNARSQPPSKIGLPVGAKMSMMTALRALIIKSANDVAVMLAERIAGSEAKFVTEMNAEAQRLGMTRSRFFNPHGLPHSGQVTSARDMGILASVIIREFPEHAQLFRTRMMRIGKIKLKSHNVLLKSLPGADGMKTGFICASGFNIVASATRSDRRLVAVVLGESSARERNARAARLLEHGFETYFWKSFFAHSSLSALPVDPASPRKPVNFRKQVRVWSCGYRPSKKKKVSRAQPINESKNKRAQLIIDSTR